MFERRTLLVLLIAVVAVITGASPVHKGQPRPSILEQFVDGRLVFSADHFGGSLSGVAVSNDAIAARRLPGWNPYVGMGRMLIADGYHYGQVNPLQWIALACFPDDIGRQIALLVIAYDILLIIALMWLARRGGLPVEAGAIGAMLLLSAPYFSQAGNFVYGCHTVYLALIAAWIGLDCTLRAARWRTLFIAAPIVGWLMAMARADVLVYTGLLCGVVTVAHLLAPDADAPPRGRLILRGAAFLLIAALLTAFQTIPLKLIGGASARAVVSHMGFGMNLLHGAELWLETFILKSSWGNGWGHRGMVVVLALIGVVAPARGFAARLRLVALGGHALLFLIVSRVLDPLFLFIGFDTQPPPFSILADVFTFAACAAGAGALFGGALCLRRVLAYALAATVGALGQFGLGVPVGAAVLATIIAAEVTHHLSARAVAGRCGIAWAALGIVPLAALVFVGETFLAAAVTPALKSLMLDRPSLEYGRAIAVVVIALWGAIGIVLLRRCTTTTDVPRDGASCALSPLPSGSLAALCVLGASAVTLMKATPAREIMQTAVLRDYEIPEAVRPYLSATDFRTLNLFDRDPATNGPAPYTYESSNFPLTFPMYAPFVPYLETTGGHSLAPRSASDFSDLINYGYLWDDERHPRAALVAEWEAGVAAGELATTSSASAYGMMRALKKSVLIFNADTPFTRFSATRYVITHQRYDAPRHLREVATVHEETLGRRLRRKVWSEAHVIYEVANAVPRIYLPTTVVRVDSDADAAEALRTMTDPTGAVVMARSGAASDSDADSGSDAGAGAGRIASVTWTPDLITATVEMTAAGPLVLSDPWFPGWQAFVDGAEVPIHRANVSFRAIDVPTGPHTVEFRYHPPGWRAGLVVSLLTLIVCTVGTLLSVRDR